MAKSLIADKTKMFDLFTRILDRSQKGKDSELIKYVQEATDFWTIMMLEEHQDSNQNFIRKMSDMQYVCQTLLDELLLILEERAICVAREGTYAGADATEAPTQDLSFCGTREIAETRRLRPTGTNFSFRGLQLPDDVMLLVTNGLTCACSGSDCPN